MNPFFVIFSGQSSEYMDELKLLALNPEVAGLLKALEADLVAECALPEVRRSGYFPAGMRPWSWATGAEPAPPQEVLIRSEVSQPMLFLTAVCHAVVSKLFPGDRQEITGYSGHSQGIVAALFVSQGRADLADRLSKVTRYMMWQGIRMQNSCGWFTRVPTDDGVELTPMLAVTGASRAELEGFLATFPEADRPDISLCNAPDRFVLSGNPAQLARVLAALKKKFGPESPTRRLWFDTEPLAVSGAYHCRLMAQGRVDIDADLARLALDFDAVPAALPVYSCHDGSRLDLEPNVTRTLMDIQYTGTVDWPATLGRILAGQQGLAAILIPGPGPGLRKLTAGLLMGARVRVVSAVDALAGPAPSVFAWPDVTTGTAGTCDFSSRFTERTGKKPLILAGMTPTTATAPLVAAAANAGYVAELAGGGQVTEKIFRARMQELAQLLLPEATVVLNTLYLDPYLYDLHIRKEGLLFRLKKEGFPLAGFTLTAGIPPVAEAVALLDRAREHDLPFCSFKAGTPEQIEQVIAIAKAAPAHDLVVQIEGGEGGGHHSWYGLRNLLNRSYARLRDLPNVSIAAGGGVRDAEDVTALLSGAWYGGPVARPLDAVLIGTLAMAAAEAETSPSVKAALAAAAGEPSGWPRGPQAPVVSGRSGLGAPIWYLQNSAARVARLADELSANPAKLPALREDLIRALAKTAKPYFGDLESMTYAAFLQRFVELTAMGTGGPYEHGAWLAADHEERFANILRRVLQRLDAEATFPVDAANPAQTVKNLVERFPDLSERILLPQDRAYFTQQFDAPGKPLPFLPVIDAELRRRFLSDSLFASHAGRFDADAVLVIPGPRAVGGITKTDVPAADLFDGLLSGVGPGVTRVPEAPRVVTWPGAAAAAKTPLFHVLGNHVWTRLLRAAFVRTENGLRKNPLAQLVVPRPGDELRLDASSFRWICEGEEKLALTLADRQVTGRYRLAMAGEGTAELPLAFELAEGWQAPAWQARPFFAAVDEVYRERAFRDPAPEGEYAQALGRPTEYRPHPFLPWYASAALRPMVSAVAENPLGLLHYRCRVLHVGGARPGMALRMESADQAGLQMRHHFKSGETIHVEVDGEFIPRARRAGGVPARGLPASAFAVEEMLYETDVVLGETELTAPADTAVFALCGGDRNPLHADAGLARLVGFEKPIHHGLWTQAAVVAQIEKSMIRLPRAISRLSTRFLGPVELDGALQIRVVRRGRAAGRHLLRASVLTGGVPAAEIDLMVEPHTTAYVCPGQGVQKKGMHEPGYSRSEAARDVWDRADAYTRSALGFSLLHAVRENPLRMTVGDGEVFHPEGVLQLTQFTQVALVVFSCAAVAELRETGAFVEHAHFSGHSLGEYSALSAIGDLLTLEDVVRVVYHRGLTMQNYVPRDEQGHSPFRMGVIRPNHAGISEKRMFELVAGIDALPGCHIEIVNYNCRGKQYAVTGYRAGLDALRDRLGDGVTGKPPYVEVPGIDVPFHSTLLREGVDAFRKTLESVFPERIAPERLVGRYWPNLTGRVFSLTPECLDDVLERTGSERVARLKAELAGGSADPERTTRGLLIEMLAYQFASPVQWISIQEGLAAQGIHEVIEIGPGHQPTLSNLLHQTLAGLNPASPVLPLHLENHFEWIVGKSAEDQFCVFPALTRAAAVEPVATPAAPARPATEMPPKAAPVPVVASSPAGDSGSVTAREPVECGLFTLLALLSGGWPDELESDKSLEDLLQGNSARRNQMLSELQKEFGLKKTDGLADLPLKKLHKAIADQTAGAYRLPGPNLTAARKELFTLLPGLTPEDAVRCLTNGYAVDADGAQSLITALVPFARDGKSKVSGRGNPFPFPAGDAASSRAILDQAAAMGLGLTGPAPAASRAAGGSAATVDAAVLQELRDELTGPSGVLTKLGEVLNAATGRTGLGPVKAPAAVEPRGVPLDAPVFNEEHAVLLSSAGNWIREDAVRLATGLAAGREPDAALAARVQRRFSDSGMEILRVAGERTASESVKKSFDNWLDRLQRAARPRTPIPSFELKSLQGADVALPAIDESAPSTLIVTGAGPRSIAEAVVKLALSRGWTVISGVSSLDDARVRAASALYREHASPCARMWIAPVRQGSFDDVDAFARWAVRRAPAGSRLFLLPFAAVGQNGMTQDIGPEHEQALRINLLGVERLVARCAEELAGLRDERTLACVLPMSPNQGDMGGDGIYGESKIALRALLHKWYSEPLLRKKTRLAGAIIGWVRGTGLMHGQDDLALQIETALGVKTFDTDTMGGLIFALAVASAGAPAEPFTADCTGGLATIPDWGEAFRRFRAQPAPAKAVGAPTASPAAPARPAKTPAGPGVLPFAPNPPAAAERVANSSNTATNLRWQDWIVVVGYGELGPYGDEECRWQAERHGRLLPEGVLHIALMSGLARYDAATGEYLDAATGARLSEREAAAHFADAVAQRVGIRWRPETGADAGSHASIEAITLTESRLIPVENLDIAKQICAQDPAYSECVADDAGQVFVRKLPGGRIYLACRRPYRNRVAGMLPSGWHPSFFGFSENEIADRDRNTLLMLTATAGAIRKLGCTMQELFRHISPVRVGNTLGTGIGGMERLIRLYTDPVWNAKRDPISLQESLGNVGAGHVSQELLGNYGPMVSPVSACATAGISVEIAWEKLRLNRADFMVAGAFDDISYAGTVGFDDMNATVNSAKLADQGIPAQRMSRPQDRRRHGFIESQGGGTLLMMRAADAVRLGLPIHGIVGRTWSFGDGLHQSIPAPGFGALSVAQGGRDSELVRALSEFGLTVDDIGAVSLHGTSTPVNDPHETGIFQDIFEHLGRTRGLPALAVSQKAVTGHTKGGASACQMIGVMQMMRDRVVPGHLNLDDLEEKQQKFHHLVFPAQPLPVAPSQLKAACVSTLGFGHVSSMVLMVNPEILLAQLEESVRKEFLQQTAARRRPHLDMEIRLGLQPLVKLAKNRTFAREEDEKRFLLEGKNHEER